MSDARKVFIHHDPKFPGEYEVLIIPPFDNAPTCKVDNE
jgi:hypothetical protein